jgi:hypothetical protein
MRRTVALILAALAVSLGTVGTAWAITGGQIDGTQHPNVAMIVFYQPDGRFRCSATLVSPTVLVTAAHRRRARQDDRDVRPRRALTLAARRRRPG